MAERRWLKSLSHFITRKRSPKNKYKLIRQIDNYDDWNTISSSTQCDIQC